MPTRTFNNEFNHKLKTAALYSLFNEGQFPAHICPITCFGDFKVYFPYIPVMITQLYFDPLLKNVFQKVLINFYSLTQNNSLNPTNTAIPTSQRSHKQEKLNNSYSIRHSAKYLYFGSRG